MLNFPIEYFDDEIREGYYVPPIMKHCWAAQMEVVKTVDEICKKNDIKYYLFSGTLLGAVRHGGYIPWDDDVDICMLRRDYQKFLKVAPLYMPDRYYIRNIHTDPTYRQCLTRFCNDDEIVFNDDSFWEKGHGFLCPAGIDIFPLDYIPEDKKRLEEILYDTHYLYTIAINYDETGLSPLVEKQIKDIEWKYNTKIIRDDTISQQMHILMEQVFANIKSYEGKKVHIPMYWMEHPQKGIPVSAFENAIEMKFENTTYSVPYLYDKVLKSMYGNYMDTVRVCDIHDFPWYKPILKEVQNIHVEPDCIFKKDNLPLSNRHEIWENSIKSELNKTVELFGKASALAEKSFETGDIDSGNMLMEKCQQLVSNAEFMEKQIAKKDKDRVVFLSWKAEYWDYFDEYYRAEIDKGNEVYVIAVPFVRMTESRKVSDTVYLENEGYPEYVNLTDFREFVFDDVRINRIYFQNQFDDMNGATRVNPFFYSDKLSEMCDELIFVPWFKLDEYGSDDERALYMMKYFLFMPGIVKCDKMLVREKWFRDICIEELTKWAGDGTKEIWENKIELVDTDAMKNYDDAISDSSSNNLSDSAENTQAKKTLLYYLGTGQVLANVEGVIQKLEHNLSIFDSSPNKLRVKLFLEAGLEENIEKYYPKLLKAFDDVCKLYADKEWCEYIEASEPLDVNKPYIYELVESSKALYGDAGVLMHMFNRAKKPVMLQDINVF